MKGAESSLSNLCVKLSMNTKATTFLGHIGFASKMDCLIAIIQLNVNVMFLRNRDVFVLLSCIAE